MTTATQPATTTAAELESQVREIQAAAFRKFQQFSAGMDLFRTGQEIEACENEQQQDGWRAAWDADAEAEMPEHDEFTYQGVTYASNFDRR